MFLKKHDVSEIDPANVWQGDKLKRKQIADYLTPIIASIDQPFVISLNAEYGMGKTDFVKRWQCDLNNHGFKTAYFNAWETDFSENALAAFMSSLKSQLVEQAKGVSKTKIKNRISELVSKSGGFIRHKAGPMLARVIARKLIGDEEIKNLTSAMAEEALAAQEAAEVSMSAFRNEVEKLVEELTKNENDKQKRKLIIFVDELDRCRPNYALEVLESIKHLFSVPGVIFILAVDETQLRETVKTIYGSDMNGPGYFSRFFDWRFQLPLPDYYAFATYLLSLYGLEGSAGFEKPAEENDFSNPLQLTAWFAEAAEFFMLSPRQQIRCFTEINLVIRSAPTGQIPHCPVLGLLVVLKAVYPKQCQDFCLGTGNVAESRELIMSKISQMRTPSIFNSSLEYKYIVGVWEIGRNRLNSVEEEIDNLETQAGLKIQQLRSKERARILNLVHVRDHLRTSFSTPGSGSLLAEVYSRLERASVILRQ